MDPFERGAMALGSMSFLLMAIPFALTLLAAPYMVLRFWFARAEEQDPQVGLKCALYFILSLGVLMFLGGLNILVYDLVGRGNWFEKAGDLLSKFDGTHRAACSFMLSGFVFAFFNLVLILGYTNQSRFPETGRVFVGARFAVHSLIVLAATTMVIFLIFQEIVPTGALEFSLSVLMVWGPAWLIHLIMLKSSRGMGSPPPKVVSRRKRDDDDEEGEKPVRPVQPQRPTQPTTGQQQQQGGQQRQSQPVPTARPVPQRPAQGQVQPRKRPADDE